MNVVDSYLNIGRGLCVMSMDDAYRRGSIWLKSMDEFYEFYTLVLYTSSMGEFYG